ncbi:Stk1 family PASTA domain-containing Ser/Thr kinase [Streptomyces sp. NPDC048291]|uniref:Stk1 family PASTA domain-containing Ser/Thr kinase n=1 Tax=Streptomyces sp. NPDC048291 TaxID=3365530 RepID=UPI00371410BC
MPGSEEQAFAGGDAGGGYWHAAPPAAPAPLAFGGRYEPGALLGCGGTAEVHLAHDTRLDRMVAVKTLRVDLAHDEVSLARFRREAQSTASLNHPSIAAVYDTGEDVAYRTDGTPVPLPYLVMEYVDGVPLSEALYGQPPLTPERVLELAGGILRALAHSHTQGIVHRDIKPANVMLTSDGQVKVMDFGIARDARNTGMTRTSVVVGTAQYLAPEQAQGRGADARADLYAVGCLLYELLTRRPPFTGASALEVICRHVQETPRPPSSHHPGVGSAVDAIVLRALEKDPEARYRSADHMLADIEEHLGPGALREVPVAAPERSGRSADDTGWTRQYPLADGGTGRGETGRGGTGRRRVGIALVAASVAAVLLALVAGRLVLGHGSARDDTAAVPDLVGQTLAQARRTADNVGLVVSADRQAACAGQPKGRVCEQRPADGRLAKGHAVSVRVSTGVPRTEVPDVTDKKVADASRILTGKGFEVAVRQVESERDAGTVLEQEPGGGESVESGSGVTLTVARARQTGTVPDLTGATLGSARKLLAAQGLTLGDTTEVRSGAESGTVVGQSIAQGKRVARGTTVDVRVAEAAATVHVPRDLAGRPVAVVRAELRLLGLGLEVADGSDGSSTSVVTSSSPAAGTEVAVGSTVVVSTGTAGDDPRDGSTTTRSPLLPPLPPFRD